MDSIEQAVENTLYKFWDTPKRIDSMSIGGGTPSLLSCDQWETLLDQIERLYPLANMCDAQVEICADSHVTKEKLGLLRERGITRISVGIQTWSDVLKRRLNRPPTDTVVENRRVCELLRSLSFSVNHDLLYGIPGQPTLNIENTLNSSLEFEPDQISFYCLSLKPDIPLYRKDSRKACLRRKIELYNRGRLFLIDHGYEQETRNNFVKHGRSCGYETAFAEGVPTLGIGSGAVSFLDEVVYRQDRLLEDKHENGGTYLGYEYSEEERMNVYVIKRLEWLTIDLDEFRRRFNVSFEEIYREPLRGLLELGLVASDGSTLRVTEKGVFFVTAIKRCFYAADYIRGRREYYLESISIR
jgi:oxygen-independent coproporphyrinogen-3 oxidase